ncbi:MAG: aspartate/glutamate racemase family protein [Sphingomonadales bacterium]
MIGLFDSGTGGLTILQAARRLLPGESFTYLGDHARMPYGEMSGGDVVSATGEMVEKLFDEGCNLVVLACNTASSIALRTLQETWLADHYPERRVLGILVPMVENLTGLQWDRRNPGLSDKPEQTVAVFATRRTVESGAYVEEIVKRAPSFKIHQQACPGIASLIEAGVPKEDIAFLVGKYVGELMDREGLEHLDGVILGCTHYPLVEDLFREALPPGTRIASQPAIVARALQDYLSRHPEFGAAGGKEGEATGGKDGAGGGDGEPALKLLTTGDPEALNAVAAAWLGGDFHFERA